MDEYYRTFPVDGARITVISEGTGLWPMELALDQSESDWRPFVSTDSRNRMPIGFNLALIEHEGMRILIDAGFGEPTTESLKMERALEVVRTPGLEGALAALGIAPDEIDLIAITHAHGDHITGTMVEHDGRLVPRFPRARYVIGAPEYHDRSFRGMWGGVVNRSVDALFDAGQLELVEGRREVAPGLELIPTGGESPGHAIYRLAAGGAVFYALGDLYHHPVEVSHPDWTPVRRNAAQLLVARQSLAEAALAENALLMTAHMPFPGLGRLRRFAAGIAWVTVEPPR